MLDYSGWVIKTLAKFVSPTLTYYCCFRLSYMNQFEILAYNQKQSQTQKQKGFKTSVLSISTTCWSQFLSSYITQLDLLINPIKTCRSQCCSSYITQLDLLTNPNILVRANFGQVISHNWNF